MTDRQMSDSTVNWYWSKLKDDTRFKLKMPRLFQESKQETQDLLLYMISRIWKTESFICGFHAKLRLIYPVVLSKSPSFQSIDSTNEQVIPTSSIHLYYKYIQLMSELKFLMFENWGSSVFRSHAIWLRTIVKFESSAIQFDIYTNAKSVK